MNDLGFTSPVKKFRLPVSPWPWAHGWTFADRALTVSLPLEIAAVRFKLF